MTKATFAAGCFWGVEETFRSTHGVTSTRAGYTGGTTPNPTYEQVCSGKTGHVEAVEIDYDSKKVSYDKLLEIFWSNHNPTQGNRQGWDVGTQYRSAIFYHNSAQKKAAEKSKALLTTSGKYNKPITTEIVSTQPFWPAEEYHQQYLAKRGQSSCHT